MIIFKMTIIDDRQCDENAYKLDNYCYYYNGLHIYSHDDDGVGIMNISIITIYIYVCYVGNASDEYAN